VSRVITGPINVDGATKKRVLEAVEQLRYKPNLIARGLRNRSGNPLLLEDILANLRLADGTLSVSAGSPAQYEEIFVAYPKLAALHGNVLAPRTVIAPGQSLDGTVFWAIRRSKLEWEGRQGLDFTFTFQYQPSLRLTSRAAVTVLPQ